MADIQRIKEWVKSVEEKTEHLQLCDSPENWEDLVDLLWYLSQWRLSTQHYTQTVRRLEQKLEFVDPEEDIFEWERIDEIAYRHLIDHIRSSHSTAYLLPLTLKTKEDRNFIQPDAA